MTINDAPETQGLLPEHTQRFDWMSLALDVFKVTLNLADLSSAAALARARGRPDPFLQISREGGRIVRSVACSHLGGRA